LPGARSVTYCSPRGSPKIPPKSFFMIFIAFKLFRKIMVE